MLDLFLNGMTIYGLPILGLALLLGAGGLPIPIGLLMLAAGGLARQGLLDWPTTLFVSLTGVVLGDMVSYGLGRLAGGWVERLSQQQRAELWQKARVRFRQHGTLAIWLTRFLLTSLDVPTNLIAGGSGYAFWRFLVYGVMGRVAWLALYGGLGYAFGSQWQLINQVLSHYGGWLGLGAVVAGSLYFLLRRLHKNQSRVVCSAG